MVSVFLVEYVLPRLSPSLNFVGTILVALSIGRNPAQAHTGAPGREIYLASVLHPLAFRIGLGMIAVGFLITVVEPHL